MDKINFDFVDKVITDTVNVIFANKEVKKTSQLNLFAVLVASCKSYQNDIQFKREIDALGKYLEKEFTPTK